ncbi:MAG: hypothetical protein GF364_00940 [Candidatus Lokiarchaeota archaeon]|nr:hypothetical protein [Candidatus Lokiarchaeota archaeon]
MFDSRKIKTPKLSYIFTLIILLFSLSISGNYEGSNTNKKINDIPKSSELGSAGPYGDAGCIDSVLGSNVEDLILDEHGNIYIVGYTYNASFPTTNGVIQTSLSGESDAFICKLSPDGSHILMSTLLGGLGSDKGYSICIDSAENIYVVGETNSTDFPIISGAYNNTYSGDGDIFVSKINPDGSTILYSTFFGGSAKDYGKRITIDEDGSVYIIGATFSDNFPLSTNAFDKEFGRQGETEAFLSKLNLDGNMASDLVYSSFIGGYYDEYCNDCQLDAEENVYLIGWTESVDFPTTSGAYDENYNGDPDDNRSDVFVMKVKNDGSQILWSTYLGGPKTDGGYALDLDSENNVYITGYAKSPDFPVVEGSYDTTHNLEWDAFFGKLSKDGSSLLMCSFLGGYHYEYGTSITLDEEGNIYVSGTTRSNDFPLKYPLFDGTYKNNLGDAFLSIFNPTGSKLLYSTQFGGSNVDNAKSMVLDTNRTIYIVGSTLSNDFPSSYSIESSASCCDDQNLVFLVIIPFPTVFNYFIIIPLICMSIVAMIAWIYIFRYDSSYNSSTQSKSDIKEI